MRPTTEMQKLVGRLGTLNTKEGLLLTVKVYDVREVYGAVQLLVGGRLPPILGEVWVAGYRVQMIEGKEATS